MKRWKKLFIFNQMSLRHRLTIQIFATLAICLVMAASAIFWQLTDQLSTLSKDAAMNRVNFLAKSSGSYILNYDVTALNAFAAETVSTSLFDYLAFLDENKNQINDKKVKKEELTNTIFITREIKDGESLVGYVELGYNNDLSDAKISAVKEAIIVSFGVTILFMSVVVFLILGFSMKRLTKILPDLETSINSSNLQAGELNRVSKAVDISAQELSSISQQTSAAMQEISSMLMRTEESAQKGKEESFEVARLTSEGLQKMQNLVSEIESLKQVSFQLKDMENIIQEIADKTNVINDIVFKTQLLSFNASIEAARAGQHGRGFAVVAEEIGNLAQVSGDSATEIRSLLEDSKSKVSLLVSQTESQTEKGKNVSEETLDSFREINDSVEKIQLRIDDIEKATKEQSTGLRDTVSVIDKLGDRATDQTKTTQEISDIATNITDQSSQLEQVEGSIVKIVLGDEKNKAA